jgi:hypothetical protein
MDNIIISDTIDNTKYGICDTPITTYNNLLVKICDKLNQIYYGGNSRNSRKGTKDVENQLILQSRIIFENNTIKLFGFMIIGYSTDLLTQGVKLKFIGDITKEKFQIIQKTLANINDIQTMIFDYVFTQNYLFNKYDDSVTHNQIMNIYNQIKSGKYLYKNNEVSQAIGIFLVPYKNKLRIDNNPDLFGLLTKFDYGIEFIPITARQYRYNLKMLVSQELDESKSIQNLRYKEINTIKTGIVDVNDLMDFLQNLFYFGEFKY